MSQKDESTAKADDNTVNADAQDADGYYGEDNLGDDELDLSFLDEDEKEKK